MLSASAVGGPNLSATKQRGYRAFPGERPCLGTHAVSAMTRAARLADKTKKAREGLSPKPFALFDAQPAKNHTDSTSDANAVAADCRNAEPALIVSRFLLNGRCAMSRRRRGARRSACSRRRWAMRIAHNPLQTGARPNSSRGENSCLRPPGVRTIRHG